MVVRSKKTGETKRKSLFSDEKGATAIEYGLILALIFLALIATVSNVASTTVGMWNNVAAKVKDR